MKSFSEKEYNEALVAADRAIVKDILRRVEDSMVDALKRGDEEFVNNIARHVKMKVTKKKQQRGKAFSYRLKENNEILSESWEDFFDFMDKRDEKTQIKVYKNMLKAGIKWKDISDFLNKYKELKIGWAKALGLKD